MNDEPNYTIMYELYGTIMEMMTYKFTSLTILTQMTHVSISL